MKPPVQVIIVLFWMLLAFAEPLLADEIILFGRVKAVDPDSGTVTMLIPSDEMPAGASHAKKKDSSADVGTASREVSVRMPEGQIAPGIRTGLMLRVWVDSDGSGSKVYSASRISQGCCFDRTGVRRRLGRAGRRALAGAGCRGAGRGGRH